MRNPRFMGLRVPLTETINLLTLLSRKYPMRKRPIREKPHTAMPSCPQTDNKGFSTVPAILQQDRHIEPSKLIDLKKKTQEDNWFFTRKPSKETISPAIHLQFTKKPPETNHPVTTQGKSPLSSPHGSITSSFSKKKITTVATLKTASFRAGLALNRQTDQEKMVSTTNTILDHSSRT